MASATHPGSGAPAEGANVGTPAPAGAAPRTLLLGMGNPYLCDDAVGIRLAESLRRRVGEVQGLTYLEECSLGGLNILDLVAGYDRLVVLDSIRAGGPLGGWYRFDGRTLRETMNLTNVHDTNFATALELGRRLGLKVPAEEEIHVFAVEVQDNLTFSERMTDALESAFPACADEIFREVATLLEG
jgi:hydrogenase maturation protease